MSSSLPPSAWAAFEKLIKDHELRKLLRAPFEAQCLALPEVTRAGAESILAALVRAQPKPTSAAPVTAPKKSPSVPPPAAAPAAPAEAPAAVDQQPAHTKGRMRVMVRKPPQPHAPRAPRSTFNIADALERSSAAPTSAQEPIVLKKAKATIQPSVTGGSQAKVTFTEAPMGWSIKQAALQLPGQQDVASSHETTSADPTEAAAKSDPESRGSHPLLLLQQPARSNIGMSEATSRKSRVCMEFNYSGTCGWGKSCEYLHEGFWVGSLDGELWLCEPEKPGTVFKLTPTGTKQNNRQCEEVRSLIFDERNQSLFNAYRHLFPGIQHLSSPVPPCMQPLLPLSAAFPVQQQQLPSQEELLALATLEAMHHVAEQQQAAFHAAARQQQQQQLELQMHMLQEQQREQQMLQRFGVFRVSPLQPEEIRVVPISSSDIDALHAMYSGEPMSFALKYTAP